MTPLDICINIVTGIITGLATGAFFASRSFDSHRSTVYYPRRVVYIEHPVVYRSGGGQAASDSNPNPTTMIVFVLGLALLAAAIMSRYQTDIVRYGWFIISLIGSSIIAFSVLTWWRERVVNPATLVSISSTLVAAYNFYLFTRSVSDPTYKAYLESVSASTRTLKAIIPDAMLFQPLFQFIGLACLAIALIIAFLQCLAVLLHPIATRNTLSFAVFRNAFLSLSREAIIFQWLFLLAAYLVFGGYVITWLSGKPG